MVSMLLERPEIEVATDNLGRTPLNIAEAAGNDECGELLLRASFPEIFGETDDPHPRTRPELARVTGSA